MTWPGGSTRNPANLELEPGRVEEKIKKKKTRYNSATGLHTY
jgi:hypothetical protein